MTIVVCDSGPLIHLWQINRWSAFGVFKTIHLAAQVIEEIHKHIGAGQLDNLVSCPWHIHAVSPSKIETAQSSHPLNLTLQPADLATLVVAQELAPDLVLTDDLALRRALEAQEQTPMGSVGILLRAYKTGLLNPEALNQAIDELFVHSTLYLSPQFKLYVRRLIGSAIGSD